jgi:hypothetical protein
VVNRSTGHIQDSPAGYNWSTGQPQTTLTYSDGLIHTHNNKSLQRKVSGCNCILCQRESYAALDCDYDVCKFVNLDEAMRNMRSLMITLWNRGMCRRMYLRM